MLRLGYANDCPMSHVKLRENGAHFAYMNGGLIENFLDASLKRHFLASPLTTILLLLGIEIELSD